MYWNSYERPGYHKIPVRRAPIGGTSPYSSRPVESVETRPAPPVEQVQPAVMEETPVTPSPVTAETDWQTMALRQQAEMDNFRKRQTRRADEAITAERERLLRSVLPLADNLTRALSYDNAADNTLRQGVELTQRELLRFLAAEGVTKLKTVGHPFTPDLHEALAVVPAQVESNTIVQEVEAGYMLGDKLLRPARVVVAA